MFELTNNDELGCLPLHDTNEYFLDWVVDLSLVSWAGIPPRVLKYTYLGILVDDNDLLYALLT